MTALLEIYLVRHGETAWSLSGQHTGITDLRLTAHGEAQARALAPRLARTAFTHVLVSPRLRARQTCALALGDTACVTEPALAEWDYGDYEGKRSEDIAKLRPDWNIWRDGCPHGEMPGDISARADRLIEQLCALQGTIALFSHAQFGTALAVRWIKLPLLAGQHFSLSPASVSVLGYAAHHPTTRVLALWNETPALDH